MSFILLLLSLYVFACMYCTTILPQSLAPSIRNQMVAPLPMTNVSLLTTYLSTLDASKPTGFGSLANQRCKWRLIKPSLRFLWFCVFFVLKTIFFVFYFTTSVIVCLCVYVLVFFFYFGKPFGFVCVCVGGGGGGGGGGALSACSVLIVVPLL